MFSISANASSGTRSTTIAPPHEDSEPRTLLEGELLDLYAAILIVVPLALLLKSLWF
jgi:hypothetical protein